MPATPNTTQPIVRAILTALGGLRNHALWPIGRDGLHVQRVALPARPPYRPAVLLERPSGNRVTGSGVGHHHREPALVGVDLGPVPKRRRDAAPASVPGDRDRPDVVRVARRSRS